MKPLTAMVSEVLDLSKRAILLILGLAGFVAMADNWVVSPTLPAISANLHVDLVQAGVVITAYMIPFGLFQLVFGPLADRFGKRQVIGVAMLLFTVATGLCATAFSLTNLAIYRALTGAFAASVMPVSLALIGDIFPIAERQSAIGTFMGISFLGQGLSMAIGGSIAYFYSWRGVFAVYSLLAVVSTVLLFTAGKQIPSARNPHSEILAPYGRLLGRATSLFTYLVVLFEGILIVGSFLGWASCSPTPPSSPSPPNSPPRRAGRPCRWWPSASWAAAAWARLSAAG